MIGQIVIGVDGSPNSLTAFQYAVDLARRLTATVKTVFVIDSRKTDLPIIYTASHFDYGFERVYIPPDPGLKGFYEQVRKDIASFAQSFLDQCRREADSAAVTATVVLREGLPSGVLADETRSGDLLVVGQKGEHAHIERAIVGSTTEDVVRVSPRPVLVCPALFHSPRKMLFPYDGSPGAEKALQFFVNALGTIWDEMVVLTIVEELEESFPVDSELGYLSSHGIPYRLLTEAGKPVDMIPRVAKREGIDMILIGAHGRHKIRDYLLGPTASHLIRRSELPVLVAV
ncbi:MAG TPA: universal stress protein [Spirochaetia bacterium]|nr:universal stress protein [Spirochaetia bacterium]